MTAILTSTTASTPTDTSSGLASDVIPMSGEFRTGPRMSDGDTDLFSRQLNSLCDGNPAGTTVTSAAATTEADCNVVKAVAGAGPHVAEQPGRQTKLCSGRGQVERSDLPAGLSGSVATGAPVIPGLASQTNIAVKSPTGAYSDAGTGTTQTDAVDDEAAGRTEGAVPRLSRLEGVDRSFGDRRSTSPHVGREDRGGDDDRTTSHASAVASTSADLADTMISARGIVDEGASRPGSTSAAERSAVTDTRRQDFAAITSDVQSSGMEAATDGLAAWNALPSQITDAPAVEAATYRSAADRVQASPLIPGGPANSEPPPATGARPVGHKASGRTHSGQVTAGSDNSTSLSDRIQVFITPAAATGSTAMSADGDASTTPRSLARLSSAEGLASKADGGDVQSVHRQDAVDPTEAPGLTSLPSMPGDPMDGIPGGPPAAAGGSAVTPDGVKGLVVETQASLPAAADHEDALGAAGQVSASLMTMAAGASRFSQLAVSLQPKDLGSVRIQLDRRADGRVSIVVAATDPATLRRLMTDQEHLHATLNAASIPATDRQLTFELASPHAIGPTGSEGSADRASVSSGGMQMPAGDAGLSQRQSQDQASRDDRGGGWRRATDAGIGPLATTPAAFLARSNSSVRPAMLRGINITA